MANSGSIVLHGLAQVLPVFSLPTSLQTNDLWLIISSVLAPAMIVPAAPQVLQAFHETDYLYRTLIVTIWTLGEAISPFLAGPLSEVYGRFPIYHSGNILGLFAVLITSLSTNISMSVAFRFLSGFFLMAPTLSPAIIGDVTWASERGKTMAISQGFRIMSPFLAPIIGAYINSALGWRWVIWILSMILAAVVVLNLLTVRETYMPRILERKTSQLARDGTTGPISQEGTHRTRVAKDKILDRALRPMKVLFTSRTVLLIAVYNGVVAGCQATMTTTLTEIMEQEYSFGHGSVGLVFIAPSTGLVLGTLSYGFTSDRYLRYQARKNGGTLQPKHRLIYTLVGSFTLPAGLLFYGWTLRFHLPFIVPLLGAAVIGFSFLPTLLPVSNYFVDAFETHSASAIAGSTVVLLAFAAIFPLIGPPLFGHLGYGWGNSLIALITALFIPFLLTIMMCGPRKVDADALATPEPSTSVSGGVEKDRSD